MNTVPYSRWTIPLLAACLAAAEPGSESNKPEPPSAAAAADASPIAAPADNGITAVLPTGAHVAVIKIEGLIYGYTLKSLEQRVTHAVENGSSLIVLELDTKGGLVDSALRISRFIKSMQIPTIAWINPEAYSAGIMIAAACNQIVMAPASATGDCAPIVPTQDLSPTERAKALSPILEEFRDSASINRYDYVLFHAMCVLGVEVYRIEHRDTGEHRLVNQADYRVMVEGAWPEGPEGPPNQKADSRARPVATAGQARITVATPADRGRWVLTQKIHDGSTLLTLSQQRAKDVGLAQALVRDQAQLQEYLGAASVTMIPPNPVAMVAYWLTLPWMRALLMMALMIGVYFELQAPGLGGAGLIAVTSLLLLLVAPFLVGLAQVWHVILFLIGLMLLLAEILVIPGFGLAGIGGVVCMFIGLVLMVVPTTGTGPVPMPAPEALQRLRDSILFTLVSIIGSGVVFYYLTKYFGSLPVLNRLILKTPSPHPDGSAVSVGRSRIQVSGQQANGAGLVTPGTFGRVLTQMRPSGQADFDGQLLDVISRGEWIEPGQHVRIVEVHGNRIVVEANSEG